MFTPPTVPENPPFPEKQFALERRERILFNAIGAGKSYDEALEIARRHVTDEQIGALEEYDAYQMNAYKEREKKRRKRIENHVNFMVYTMTAAGVIVLASFFALLTR